MYQIVKNQIGVVKMKAIIYTRVSTSEQGKSGLGLEAQLEQATLFCQKENIEIIGNYQEVETGKGQNALEQRPILAQALSHAKKDNALLVVAKLDRLSRNVAFISSLMEQKVKIVVSSMGLNTDAFTMHIFASFAENERAMISQRTKAALQQLKAKGVKLGSPKLSEARKVSAESNKKIADDFAVKTLPMIKTLREQGKTLQEVADTLNMFGIPTRRGGKWAITTVANILKREESLVNSQ